MSAARFVVAQKEKKRDRVRLDVQAPAIVVGTFLDCDLVLADPIAAARHCEFAVRGDAFVVRDLGTDTGTWRAGEQVVGDVAVRSGDEIVVGTTRLVAKVGTDPPVLELQLVPQDLGFVAGRSGEFASDPDTMARREADLAAWPALRWSNRWAARLVVLGLPALLLWPRAREVVTDPGELSAAHALLFTDAGAARFPAEAEIARAQGCGACHDTFFGTPDERCAQCHASLVAEQHPFASTTTDRDRVRQPLGGYTCAGCHQEHHGPRLAKPDAAATKASCVDCHGGTAIEAGGFSAQRVATPVALETKPYGGFAFAHADHAAVACSFCHERDPAPEPERRGDFAPIGFATCARCHREGALDANVPAAFRPRADHVWKIDWHGSADGARTCGQCHRAGDGAGGFGPELANVPRLPDDAATYAAVRARYEVVPRGHGELLPDAGRDCGTCHREPQRLLAQTAVRPFWHELHLSSSPLAGAGDSAECLECHGDLESARGLVDAGQGCYDCARESTCGTCHREGARDAGGAKPLVPTAAPLPVLPTRDGVDFPHAAHLDFARHPSLAQGCFTCHEFTATRPDGPFAVPTTKASAKSCLPCHEQHDRVAGGACRRCHDDGTKGAYNDFLGKRPPPERAQRPRPWPARSAFDHFAPGHRESTELDCARCHKGASAVGGLADLRTLAAPTEVDEACRTCHLGERQRYHWR